MSSSFDEELPESVTFVESRERFQNLLKKERESRKSQKKRSVVNNHSSTQQRTTFSEKEDNQSSPHVPEKEMFRQAANNKRLETNKIIYLHNKKSAEKNSRRKSKRSNGKVQVVLLAENSKLARESSAIVDPEKFLKSHFYGNRLLRCSKKDANLTRSKQLYLPSPYFHG